VSTRALVPSPDRFADASGAPAFGSFVGPLPPVVVGGSRGSRGADGADGPAGVRLGLGARIARRKRWVYLAVSAPGEGIWIALGVVRAGYAATVYRYAYDLRARRMHAERTALGPTFACRVADDVHAPGSLASFALGGTRVAIERGPRGLSVHVRLSARERFELDAALDEATAPDAVSAIAPLGAGLWNATEKRALLSVTGRARLGDRDVSLDGATGGYDCTLGVMPRRTRWRWAFALGADEAGAPLAFNVVEGFVGEAECAAFTGDAARGTHETHPLAEPRFVFDAARPASPWRLEGDGVDLAFAPGAVHAQYTNMGLVRSRFVQPVGTFSGTLRVGGRERRLSGVPGVVEDQDVLW
jgi:hypothetical protein